MTPKTITVDGNSMGREVNGIALLTLSPTGQAVTAGTYEAVEVWQAWNGNQWIDGKADNEYIETRRIYRTIPTETKEVISKERELLSYIRGNVSVFTPGEAAIKQQCINAIKTHFNL